MADEQYCREKFIERHTHTQRSFPLRQESSLPPPPLPSDLNWIQAAWEVFNTHTHSLSLVVTRVFPPSHVVLLNKSRYPLKTASFFFHSFVYNPACYHQTSSYLDLEEFSDPEEPLLVTWRGSPFFVPATRRLPCEQGISSDFRPSADLKKSIYLLTTSRIDLG